ncbi:MAG: polysaccharide deacetylase family protein [Proteobacteria bacterium]|nr:polysaccharide deacetylase family protein [Pseudomonadota bacterium]
MTRRSIPVAILLWACCLVLPNLCAAGGRAGWPGPPSFGSRTIFEACWSARELDAPARDGSDIGQGRDTSPPERTSPRFARPALPADMRGVIRRVRLPGQVKLAALTFDMCQADRVLGYDAPIVNYLRTHRIPATFFMGGRWMRSHAERTMQIMADPLFEIGNHGWAHRNFRLIDERRMREEAVWVQAQYELIREKLLARPEVRAAGLDEALKIPASPAVFRFPYGTCDDRALNLLAELGLPAIQWNIVSADADRKRTAPRIAAPILSGFQPGSIVIFHANGRNPATAAALPLLVPRLTAQGYRFVTVSRLLEAGPALVVPECYELQPGDNLKYDHPPKVKSGP